MGRETRSTWAKRVERWNASVLTAAEFAAEIGANARTLTYWKWKLETVRAEEGRPRQRGRERAEVGAAFVEVVPAPTSRAWTETAASEALEVVLDGGVRVRVPARFDADVLRRVVAALGAR